MPIANPNYFVGNPLERLSEKRGDAAWLQEQLNFASARLVPFWRGRPLIAEARVPGGKAEALWLNTTASSEFHEGAPLILLGHLDGVPYFAIDGSASGASAETAPFSDLGVYRSLREIADDLSREDLAILGQALWILDWHRRHQFCANCGAKTEMRPGGANRHCQSCETDHFPRTDPVAIVLATYGEECLLGRGVNFPPKFFSALAGFMEPGETLEECAAREVFEEAGVQLTNVEYIFSQPWPFPSSLMVGFIADATDKELNLDTTEIAEARWVPKDDIRALLAGDGQGDLWLPPRFAIARQLLEVWVKR